MIWSDRDRVMMDFCGSLIALNMKIRFVFILFLLRSFYSFAQHSLTPDELKTLDSISLQDVVKNGPGIATGIVKDGRIIYQKYAGYANLKDSSVITNQSRFNIASNAKQFTAFAILNLVEEGKLKLSDDIRKFLPNLYPKVKAKLTIENLLNHSSGIRDVYDLWSLKGIVWWKNTFDNQDVVKLLSKQTDLNFEPGSQYLYSNSNYIILSEVIKKVSGQTFKAYTNELFRKLNMPNTSFVDDYKLINPPIAYPYFNFDTWTGYNWICNIQGDGNLFSTLADQLQWERIIQLKSAPYFSKNLLSKTQELLTSSAIKNYGYGLEHGTYNGIPYRFHEGSTGAWKATTLRFPNQNFAIVTLTNSGKAISAMQSRQAAAVLLGLKNTKPSYLMAPLNVGLPVSEKDIIGTYQTDDDFTFRFELRGADLFLIRFGRNDTKLVRESANVFHQWNDSAFKQEFKLNAQNEMEVTAYYTTHTPYTLKRINSNWKGFDFKLLNGRFYNAETETYLSLQYQGDKSYLINIKGMKSSGLLIQPNKLLLDSYSILLNGTVNELLLNGDRMKRVRFKRVK